LTWLEDACQAARDSALTGELPTVEKSLPGERGMTQRKQRHEEQQLQALERTSGYLGLLLRQEGFVRWLWEQKQLYRKYPQMELYQDLRQTAEGCGSFDELARRFRQWKQRHFLRIAGREWLGLAGFEESTAQLSDLAEVALQVGLETLGRNPAWWRSRQQDASMPEDILSRLVVMAYGKLGGNELNYVSDIDLAFFSGRPKTGSEKPRTGHQELERLCTSLTRLLRDQIGGDKVFQVDLRLRPGGKDAYVVSTCEAAVEHYQIHGQAWERQALLKARPVAGERSLGRALLQELRPFVFRRFLDFQALDELKRMRDKILDETGQTFDSTAYDVKLGIGGIREIEFVVQSFQLIYGGRFRDLDQPNTLRCLEALRRRSLLPAEAVASLSDSYVFLRQIEHWIQLDQNRAGRKLPTDSQKLARLAGCLGFDQTDDFVARLKVVSSSVHEHFQTLFNETGDKQPPHRDNGQTDQRSGRTKAVSPELNEVLSHFDGSLAGTVSEVVREAPSLRGDRGRSGVNTRVVNFLQQARRRPGLCRVLEAGPDRLKDLFHGLASSDFVAALLAHQPSLIEGLQSGPTGMPGDSPLQAEPGTIIQNCRDYEEALEWIRRLKNERILDMALSDLSKGMGYDLTTSGLTDVADFVLNETLAAVTSQFGEAPQGQLAVLGLGKLGSRQMGWLSDLDIMFVYAPPDTAETSQEERIPESVIKRIQRFIRMMSTPLQEGPGYAVDTALRPTGNYGPLVVTEARWREYYAAEADIWELQSLLRMRSVAGSPRLGNRLEEQARDFCYLDRSPERVWPRLCHLRQRMEQERSQESANRLNIKLGYGGAADLEFLAQGQQLLAGFENPGLRGRNTLNLVPPALEQLGLATEKQTFFAQALQTLYMLELRLQLQGNQSGGRISRQQLKELRSWGLWPPPDGGLRGVETWEDLVQLRKKIRELWTSVCQT
jgi:glutamate-ammonia-ligase adenylyltransferase